MSRLWHRTFGSITAQDHQPTKNAPKVSIPNSAYDLCLILRISDGNWFIESSKILWNKIYNEDTNKVHHLNNIGKLKIAKFCTRSTWLNIMYSDCKPFLDCGGLMQTILFSYKQSFVLLLIIETKKLQKKYFWKNRSIRICQTFQERIIMI